MCRFPIVVDAWRKALEFARSTTVKYLDLPQVDCESEMRDKESEGRNLAETGFEKVYEVLGGQQDTTRLLKIRLVRLFTALTVKTKRQRAISTSEERKLRKYSMQEKEGSIKELQGIQARLTSDLDSGGKNSKSPTVRNSSESSKIAPNSS